MASPPVFTINNYVPKSGHEVIELDNEPSQRGFSARRVKRVSPTPSYNNYVPRNPAIPRRRYSNVLLVLSSLFSLISFTLVLGLFFGFIKPVTDNGRTCKCDSANPQGGSDALVVGEDDVRLNELMNDVATIKGTLEAQKETLTGHDNNINEINEKFDVITARLVNLTTLSDFSEKFSQLSNEVWTNTTKVSKIVDENYIEAKKVVNETREQISQSRNINLLKIHDLELKIQTNFSKVFQKTNDVTVELNKFSIHTNAQFEKTRNFSKTAFRRFKKDNERNFSLVTQSIDNLSQDFIKLENDTNNKFKANLNTINKRTSDTEKRISQNELQCNAKFSQLSKEVWTNTSRASKVVQENYLKVKKFVNETREQMSQSRNINSLKLHDLKLKMQTNFTKVFQKTNNVTVELNKLSIHTNGQFEKNRNLTKTVFQHFKKNNERNLTLVIQSIDNLSLDVMKFENETDIKFKTYLHTINKLLDPTKFLGPRGYNGSAGQQGLRGPAGPPGPPMAIDFTNCQHGSQQGSGDGWDLQAYADFQDTKTQIMFAISCQSSVSGGVVSKSEKKVTNGYKHECTCDNSETDPKAMTCTIKYLLCKK